jgi:redox-sensing transcriptional repressor
MNSKSVPDIVIGRLPRYLQALEHLQRDGVKTTSTQELGENIGISAAQIRKDLSQFGGFGKQGTGYSIQFLIEQIQGILNVNLAWDLALVGVGDLGNALARYQGFANRGFRIILAFDSDPAKVGKQVGNLTILSNDQIMEEVPRANVKIAMLAVPATAAQSTADLLVKAGIRAILNYAPISLSLPKGVYMEEVDPIVKLQHMTYYLK